MRTSPALPWSADTERGTIRLNKYVSQQDLIDGILKWSVSDYHGTDLPGTIARTSGNKLVLQDANGQLMYEIADFSQSTNVLELTRVQGSSESLVSVEFPAVIAPQGDVQVFKDRFGYELATGTLSKVYVRINKPWIGDDSGWNLGTPDMENAAFLANSPTGGSGTYNFSLWVDWTSEDRSTPYEVGQMVEVTYGAGDSLDITSYETDFEKPMSIEGYDLNDAWNTLNTDMEQPSEGELGAIIGTLSGIDDYPIFFTQDGINAIGGVLRDDYVNILNAGSLQTNSVLNTAQKPSAVTVGVKVKILKTGLIQPLFDSRHSRLFIINIITSNVEIAQIGDSAPLFINSVN